MTERLISDSGFRFDRPTAHVQLATDFQGSASDALDLTRTDVRDGRSPLADSRLADPQRPRDIRLALKVLKNLTLPHVASLRRLNPRIQVCSQRAVLTLVDMERERKQLIDLADRLADAMRESGVIASQLAEACGVTPAAVSKWLSRETRTLSADNYAAAARALGVSETWLRTGQLPRERDKRLVNLERLQDALVELRDPLAKVLAAIDEIAPAEERHRRRQRL